MRRPSTCTPPAAGGYEVEDEAVSLSSSPAAASDRTPISSSLPTARARGCARRPASAGSAGPTRNRRSSRRSPMSATTRAAPSSTSCRPGRSRSCRSRPAGRSATAPRSSGLKTPRSVPHLLALDPEDQLDEIERRFGLRARRASRSRRRRRRTRWPSASRAASPPRAWHSSATPRTSSTRSPARASTSASRTRRRSPRAIVDAVRLGLDPGRRRRCSRPTSAPAASTPSRWALVTDGLNRLFSNDAPAGAPPARPRPRPRGPHAGAEALLHPRGRGACRRGPAADAGGGAVTAQPLAFARSIPSSIRRFASSASPQRTILTHLPGSRSL